MPPDAPLRTEVRVSTLCATSRRAIVAAFLATVLVGGCRSAGADRKAVSDPRLSAVTGPAEAAETAGLPDGPGKTLVSERCLLCHGAGLIVQQRKDAAAWGRTVTQMRTWGTPIQDEDQTAIVAYLAQHYGPGSAPR